METCLEVSPIFVLQLVAEKSSAGDQKEAAATAAPYHCQSRSTYRRKASEELCKEKMLTSANIWDCQSSPSFAILKL
ncbi:hypothetical protein Sjap_010415 [Stephania japonica]|uniref:Uncharacterized protein n=1 Tax=Stephania japonica TaxID=461633 RepID=A0AAP0J9J8_9MAGN